MENSSHLDRFVDSTLDLMPRMLRGFMREERNLLSRGVISLPQFWMLQIIRESSRCLMNDLARALSIPPSTLTSMADRLVELKLILRHTDPEDRRAVRLTLTPEGEQTLHDILEQKRDMALRIFAKVSEEDRAAYLRVIEQVVRQLNQSHPEVKP
ncbi:MAG: MarR family transcriptional regulator [Kiritimatiellia bacterium]|nr:MarR family transcriptional regulator [Kiritimatiellia bacterium]